MICSAYLADGTVCGAQATTRDNAHAFVCGRHATSTAGQCSAVFRVGHNSPATCALRFNHPGPHRDWRQVADDREELLEALRAFVEVDLEDAMGLGVEQEVLNARAALVKAGGER